MKDGQKNASSLRIVFLGTPEFAVASLNRLVEAGCNIVGVITAPDRPAGRGLELQQSPVKKYAVEKNLHLLQPERLKSPEFLEALRLLKADLQVVVAFRMLPEIVWNMPRLGTINVHASLLPQYRGAAPINWAIIHGEKFTGVTTFKLKHEIDTGDILMQKKMEIGENETAGELHDRMKELGADLLLETILGISNNEIVEKPQYQHSDLKNQPSHHAPKLFSETCRIDWHQTINDIFNLVRGLAPYPAAFTMLENKKLKVYKAAKIPEPPEKDPGMYESDGKTYLRFSCKDGYISIIQLQLEGKKKMEIKEFLRGYHFH